MIELSLRILFSLLVVLGLLWGLARIARRPLAGRAGGSLAVLARTQLSRSAAVAVVQVGDRAIVVGITDQSVNMLTDTDPADFGVGPAPADTGEVRFPGERREPLSIAELAAAGARRRPATGFGLHRLHGSILSPDTWRQLVAALKRGFRK